MGPRKFTDEELISNAEIDCMYYHKDQVRKSTGEPYANHPFAVRDILKKYGYSKPLDQMVALLHDTIEDTVMSAHEEKLVEKFGGEVYQGVYILSKNTIGRDSEELMKLYSYLGLDFAHERKDITVLTPRAYQLRLLFGRDTYKRVKIADLIHNTSDLSTLAPKSIVEKLEETENFYIPLGSVVCPEMVKELMHNIEEYKNSEHYKNNIVDNSDLNYLKKEKGIMMGLLDKILGRS